MIYTREESELGGASTMGVGEAISTRAQAASGPKKPIKLYSNEHPEGVIISG
jgi:hypothetical protein